MGGAEGGLAMLTTQPFHSTYPFGNSTNSSNGALVKTEDATENEFPAGLRVLVVDDDPICLVMLENLLRRCLYKVTTCGQATTALSMLRENKDRFDLVISDVCMPDMDGFMLLELVGLEMDLPVIMMSANGETSAVMKGITHGACDYLLKPVRIEELRNIWQHVVRKKRKDANENKHYGSADHERLKREADEGEQLSPPSDSCDGKLIKKRKEIKDDDDEENEQENDDPSTSKKPRVVWSVELHQQFVNAVNHLGIDKAVPKRILELMNVQGLTRENVASHLQKYRLYLKRISGVSNQQVGMHLAFGAIPDSSLSSLTKLDGLGDFRTLVTAGQLPSYTLASLQAGVLNRLNMPNNVGAGSLNSPGISLMSLQGINCGAIGRPQISPHTLTNQGGLLPGLSSNMNLEQISQTQHQFAHVGHFSTLTDDAVQMTVLQQQLEAANGLGSSSHAGGMIRGRPTNSGNNSFRLQLLQHEQQQFQQGPEDLPGGLLGQCLISSETSLDCANQLSGAGSLNGVLESGANAPSRGTGGGLIASVANGVNTSATNISRSFTRMPALDCKPLHLAASSSTQCSFSGPSCTGVSTASLPTGMKDLSDHEDSLLLRSSATKPAALGIKDLEFKHGLCQNIRQSWQVGQVPSLILSPKLGQLTGGQNLDAGLGQSAIQSQVVHSQKMNFQARAPVDEETVMPRATTQSNNEQFTSGSLLRFMEQPLPDSLRSMKIDGGLASEQFSSADELLNIFFKQHQEGTSFAEGDLISDGYSLQNMYMK